MCYTWDKRLKRSPCVTRGRGNLNVSHVLHVGNFAILSQNMYDPSQSTSVLIIANRSQLGSNSLIFIVSYQVTLREVNIALRTVMSQFLSNNVIIGIA